MRFPLSRTCYRLFCLSLAASAVAVTSGGAIGQTNSSPFAPTTSHATVWVRLTSPQQVSVAAGKEAVIELQFTIAPKLHINSHMPTSETLLPTRLAVTEAPGLKVSAVDFPAGERFTFPIDPGTKLDVYSGEFVLKAHIVAQRGAHLLEGVLRYQACDNAVCYPPKTLPIEISVIAQ